MSFLFEPPTQIRKALNSLSPSSLGTKWSFQRVATRITTISGAMLMMGLSTGCGPKTGEVIERFAPQYNAMRVELAAIASLIPDKVTPTIPPPQLDPLPEFKDKRLKSNTSIVMYENLTDPDLNLYNEKKLDCYYSNNLITHIRWSGPKNPMSDKAWKQGARKELENQLQYPLDIRYIGVVRVFKHELAKATTAENFNGGGMVLGVFLYDRQSKSIVAQGLTMARPDEQVSYRYTEGKDPVQALENWANSSLNMNAKAEILTAFEKVTGGTFGLH